MKKTTTKKTSNSKKGLSPSGKKLTSRKPSGQSSSKTTQKRSTKASSVSKYPSKELHLIYLSVATVVFILSYYFNAFGIVGEFLKVIGRFFFGSMCFAIPAVLLIITIHVFIKGGLSPHKHRYVFSSIGIMCIGGLHTLYCASANPDFFSGSFINICSSVLDTSTYYKSGGAIGALLSLPLRSLVSSVGAAIILITMVLICFVITTGKQPLIKLAGFISSSLSDFIKSIKDEKDAEDEKGDGIKITGVTEDGETPRVKTRKRAAAHEDNEDIKDSSSAQTEFKINLYDDKKDKSDDIAETKEVVIPDDIKKMAMEESGGVEQEKEDTSPIEVDDDEIETDYIEYTFPPVDLLMKAKTPSGSQDKPEDLRTQAKKLVDTLQSFGVEAKVLEVSKGPSVTRFELQPSAGVKVSKIVNLADDIALNLAAFGVRIEAPIPGKAAVGIEIPNKSTSMVALRDVIDSDQFRSFDSKTAFAMGKDISGQPVISDISKMPHMLIAGATGSGKSVCINSLITSILYKADPNEVKLILIDPKVVELGVYNGIPHLLIPVVTDPRRAAGALNWAVQEMVKRYSMFATANVRDIKGYNEYASMSGERQLEQIIIVIDELADLMMVSPHEVEDSICRLAQMARAAGMHLVIATQRPSVDVITGLIKANVPSRIAFSVSSQIDSRTILDMGGAEKLLGKGDMLFLPMGASKPKRLQGAFVSDKEIERIVEFVKADSSAHYSEDIIEHIENSTEDHSSGDDSDADDLLPQAIEIVVEIGQASASLLQRKLKVGYSRAGRLIDQLEERGIIGPHEGSKPRKVLMSRSEFQEMMVNNLEE